MRDHRQRLDSQVSLNVLPGSDGLIPNLRKMNNANSQRQSCAESAQGEKLARVIKSLGDPGASPRAAQAVLNLLAQEPFPLRASLVL